MKRIERIYAFLKYYKSSSIKFRTKIPDYSNYHQIDYDWKYLYGDMQEEVPDNMLNPKGKPVRITAFCDANLYHDETTGRAVSGIILLLNKTPIDWTSKH